MMCDQNYRYTYKLLAAALLDAVEYLKIQLQLK